MVKARSGSKPSGTARRLTNARPISPAPISSTSDSASCPAARSPRTVAALREDAGILFSAATALVLVACHAGTRLAAIAQTSAAVDREQGGDCRPRR